MHTQNFQTTFRQHPQQNTHPHITHHTQRIPRSGMRRLSQAGDLSCSLHSPKLSWNVGWLVGLLKRAKLTTVQNIRHGSFSFWHTKRWAAPKTGRPETIVLSCGEHSNRRCGSGSWLLEKPIGGEGRVWSWGGACMG